MGAEQTHPGQPEPGPTPSYIADIQRRTPTDWEDPRVKVVRLLIEQSGILPTMVDRNPGLDTRIADFLVGDKNILVVGGESGMGKSLMSADLRKMHADLSHVLPVEHHRGLAVMTWDRTHQAFFEEISTVAGETIPLPKGETHIRGRRIASGVIGDQVHFVRKYIGEDTLILIEAPLIGTRGETVFDELGRYRGQAQTFIMHSPESRDETLRQGRFMETSGQPQSMGEIREKLLRRILGKTAHPTSTDEQDEIIKQWWVTQLAQWEGMIVEWGPNDNREGYNNSVKLYKEKGIKPDHLAPRSVSRATRNQLESVVTTIPDIDEFIRLITG